MPSSMMNPQMIETIFPIAFLASYAMLRRYRDPKQHGGTCLHLRDCRYYDKRRDAPRDKRNPPFSSASDEKKKPDFSYYIYMVFAGLIGTLTLAPAIIYVSYHLRQIRLGYYGCTCACIDGCPFSKEHFAPPKGCENWTYRSGGYDRPDGHEWRRGIKIGSSSAPL